MNFDIVDFMLYWLVVVVCVFSEEVVVIYCEKFGFLIFEWWVLVYLMKEGKVLVCDIEVCVMMEKLKVSCVVDWFKDRGFLMKCVDMMDCCFVYIELIIDGEVLMVEFILMVIVF